MERLSLKRSLLVFAAAASCAALPVSIGLMNTMMIFALLLWYLSVGADGVRTHFLQTQAVSAPLWIFFFIALFTGWMGLAPLQSSIDVVKRLLGTLFLLLLFDLGKNRYLLIFSCLVAAQSLIALHSVLESAAPDLVSPMYIGAVTESGQLTLVLFTAIALFFASETESRLPNLYWLLGLAVLASAVTLGFSSQLALSSPFFAFLGLLLLCFIGVSGALALRHFRSHEPRTALRLLLSQIFIPLLIAALIVNLKRGPWAGVLLGAILFTLLWKPRYALIPAVIAAIAVMVFDPVRERLFVSIEHFFIAGGRSTIWSLGVELLSRFPLGIGYDNSSILKSFSFEIPSNLEHFHNNILNVAVETGWIGVGVFLWWHVRVLRTAWFARNDLAAAALGCGFIAWMAAGIVEYNFGDSEVYFVLLAALAFFCIRVHEQKPSLLERT